MTSGVKNARAQAFGRQILQFAADLDFTQARAVDKALIYDFLRASAAYAANTRCRAKA
jgi:hypothetical protein